MFGVEGRTQVPISLVYRRQMFGGLSGSVETGLELLLAVLQETLRTELLPRSTGSDASDVVQLINSCDLYRAAFGRPLGNRKAR